MDCGLAVSRHNSIALSFDDMMNNQTHQRMQGKNEEAKLMTISTRSIVVSGVLIAISAVLALTGLGYFPVPNVTASATIMQVPPIIGGVLEGPLVGAIVGFVFGIDSLVKFSSIVLTAPAYANGPAWLGWLAAIVIILVPRLLIGPAAWLTYKSLRSANEIVALGAAGVIGSLANTVLVIGLAILLQVFTVEIIVPVIPQAIFESALAAIVTIAVVAAWKRIETGRSGSSV